MGVLDELLNRFFSARRAWQVAQLAERVAQEQRPRVWRLLCGRAGTLGSHAEARGYMRCRARHALQRGLRRLGGTTEHSVPLQQRIIDRALELISGHFAESMPQPVQVLADHRRAA
jgi:hypothetical protein